MINNTEVQYTIEHKGTTKFKYTLTTNNEVRIKIPDRFIGTVYEQDWIGTCKEMTAELLKVERSSTLRCRLHHKVGKDNPKLHLRYGVGTKHPRLAFLYFIYDNKIEQVEK